MFSFFLFCEVCNIGVVIGGVYNFGILVIGFKLGVFYNYDLVFVDVLEIVCKIEVVCDCYEVCLVDVVF